MALLETDLIWINIKADIKVHGANMGPIWGRNDPGGPHVDPMNFAIWERIPMHHPSAGTMEYLPCQYFL